MCDIGTVYYGTQVYYWHWTSQLLLDLVNLLRCPLEHFPLWGWVYLRNSLERQVENNCMILWRRRRGGVFTLLLVEANRIRPKGFHVLCSHSPWGNDVKLKELVSLREFKMIMKDFKAESIRNWLFFVWLQSPSDCFLFLLTHYCNNALTMTFDVAFTCMWL